MKIFQPRYDNIIALSIALLWAILVAILCHCFYSVQFADGSVRYAMQAEYFAKGDWFLAFHPRFGVLFQILTGSLVWLLGIDGLFAGQLVASFSLSAAALCFYIFASKFANRFVTWMVFIVVLTCPTLNSWTANGLRENTRVLFSALFLLGFTGVFLKEYQIKAGMVWLSISLSAPILLQSHAFLPCWLLTIILMGILIYQRRYALMLFLFLTEVISSAIICTMIWAYTGWFVPAIQYIRILEGIRL